MRTFLITLLCFQVAFIFAQSPNCTVIDFEDVEQGTHLDGMTIENITFSGPQAITQFLFNTAYTIGHNVGLSFEPLVIEFAQPVSSFSFGYSAPFIGSAGFALDVLQVSLFDSQDNLVDVQYSDISPVEVFESLYFHQLPDISKVEIRQYFEEGFTRPLYADNLSYNCPCTNDGNYSTVDSVGFLDKVLTFGDFALKLKPDVTSIDLNYTTPSQYVGTQVLKSSIDDEIHLFFGRPISQLSFGIQSTMTASAVMEAITVDFMKVDNQFYQNGGPDQVATIDLIDHGFGIFEGQLNIGLESITKAAIKFTNLAQHDTIVIGEIQAVCGCGEFQSFVDQDIQGEDIFSAQLHLISESAIQASSTIDFDSGDRITLLPNFQVTQGSVFHAYISPCVN